MTQNDLDNGRLICLVGVAGLMLFQSVERLITPAPIQYKQAIFIATIGLLVNLACAWLLAPKGDLLRLSFEDIIRRQGLETPSICVESASASVIKYLLGSGEYLSFLPRDFIINEERDRTLVPVKLHGGNAWRRDLFILYRQKDLLSPAATALVRQLHGATADLAREVGWIEVPARRRRGTPVEGKRKR